VIWKLTIIDGNGEATRGISDPVFDFSQTKAYFI